MKQLEYVLNNQKEVLGFLKSQYPMYHLSNVFFRDVQYGILKMFEKRGEKVSYPAAEKIANEFVGKMEKEKVFNKIDQQSWVLNFPEYKKPVVVPAASAKPAPGASPAKSPAVAAARPALPPLGGAKPAGAVPAGVAPAATRPALPPLASAKPAVVAKPALPPLSSGKPVGGKPALPPLSSGKPVGAKPVAETPALQEPNTSAPEVVTQVNDVTAEQAKVETLNPKPAKAAASSAVPTDAPTGQKKTLPPLKGNYTPAGKK
jgi:hypothetical protein